MSIDGTKVESLPNIQGLPKPVLRKSNHTEGSAYIKKISSSQIIRSYSIPSTTIIILKRK